MPDYSRSLGDAVKRARGRQGFSQREVAEAANIDTQTVLKIIKETQSWKCYMRWFGR